MKYLTLIAVLLFTLIPTKEVQAFNAQGCPVPSDEKLVCSVVMCNPIGLAINKSRPKCIQVNHKFAIYLATLGFWDKPPKCKMRDQNCAKTGNAGNVQVGSNICNTLTNTFDRKSCIAAVTGQVDQAFCDSLTGQRKAQCQAKLPPKNCGVLYKVDPIIDNLGQCLTDCQNNPASCVKNHSPINCSAIASPQSFEFMKCQTECARWGMCSGQQTP